MDVKLQGMMNDQIKHELYSAHLYLAMAAYCESADLPGISHWLKVQAKEELGHGMKLFEFLVDTGNRVVLQGINRPPVEFKSAADVFEQTLAHEKSVTARINSLYNLAVKVNDPAAAIMLQWFVTEQVEEEKNASQILSMLRKVKPDSGTLIMLDRQLGKREG
jgi:ferritin